MLSELAVKACKVSLPTVVFLNRWPLMACTLSSCQVQPSQHLAGTSVQACIAIREALARVDQLLLSAERTSAPGCIEYGLQ